MVHTIMVGPKLFIVKPIHRVDLTKTFGDFYNQDKINLTVKSF